MALIFSENVMRKQLHDKFRNQLFCTAVTECIMNANPLYKDNKIPASDRREMFQMTNRMLTSIGSYESIMDSALSRRDNNPFQRLFLERLDEACSSTATEAANRVVDKMKELKKEDDLAPKDAKIKKSSDDILKSASLSENEFKDFKNKIDKLDVDTIAERIEDKVVDTVKAENSDLMREKALKSRLADELKEMNGTGEEVDNLDATTDGLDAQSNKLSDVDDDEVNLGDGQVGDDDTKGKVENVVESYLGLLDQPFAKHHSSLFSSLLSKVTESILLINDTEHILADKAILNVACEAIGVSPKEESVTQFKQLDYYFNQLEKIGSATEGIQVDQSLMDEAFANTISVYTALETLNSLHLYTPDRKAIESFVRTNTEWTKLPDKDFSRSTVASRDAVTKDLVTATESLLEYNKPKHRSSDRDALTKLSNNYAELLASFESITERSQNMDKALTAAAIKVQRAKNLVESAIEGIDAKSIKLDIPLDSKETKQTIGDLMRFKTNMVKSPLVERVVLESVGPDAVKATGFDSKNQKVNTLQIRTEFAYESCNLTQDEYLTSVLDSVFPDESFKNVFFK